MSPLGCICIADTVHMWFTPSSTHLASAMLRRTLSYCLMLESDHFYAHLLCAPVMMIQTSRASMTVLSRTCQQIILASKYVLLLDSFSFHWMTHLRNANGQGQFWDFADIAVEKPRICNNRLIRQCFYTCAGSQRRAWLIKGDVPIWANTTQEEFNATMAKDGCFVASAFFVQIWRVPVQHVNVLG